MQLVVENKIPILNLTTLRASMRPSTKNMIKKGWEHRDSRTGKSGVPLSCIICPTNAGPAEATDENTHTMWAASFETPQYRNDNCEVYHLFNDLLTRTEGETWFEKVSDGDRGAAHLLCVNIMSVTVTTCDMQR